MSLLTAVFRGYRLWLAAVAGYLAGSVLMADLVSKAANRGRESAVDLRSVGSGNPGAANAVANLGKAWGATVMAGDILKGAAGAQAGRLIAGDTGAYVAATTAVIGHCFPVWSDFRGGKGVATSAGTTLVTLPMYTALDVGVAAGSFVFSRHAAKATYVAGGVFIAVAWLWNRFQLPNGWGPKPTAGLPWYALISTSIIFYKFLTAPPQRENAAVVDESAGSAA